MHTLGDVITCLEEFAPVQYQESYDNCGLQVGSRQMEVSGILLTLDITEEVIAEAISSGANLIISHHPLIFGGIKNLTDHNAQSRCILEAIKHDIALYAMHTNIDNHHRGVSYRMAEKLDLKDIVPLAQYKGQLVKLVTFIPKNFVSTVQKAIFEAGAGHIGNYDSCSYQVDGTGTFRAGKNARPFVGEINELHQEPEVRFETIFPIHLEKKIIQTLLKTHPYEEVAYDLYPLQNSNPLTGAGALGICEQETDEIDFLHQIKKVFKCEVIRHSPLPGKKIKKVALCGGSGYSFLKNALHCKADIFITGDIKYHQFSEAENKIIIADIGHYESEQYILEVFYEILIKNFPKFAVCFTKVKTNPINYF